MHTIRKSRRRLLPALAATVAVTALPVPASAAPTALSWGPCPAEVAAPELECSTLAVPLDYRSPQGRQIQLALSRLPSRNPAQRRGILLTNSGGPGGEGLRHPLDLKAVGLPQQVLDRYDVIGMDPRGVGRSAPVTCDLAKTPGYFTNIPTFAANEADIRTSAELGRQVAAHCAASASKDLLPHISTANTARDLDRVRAALGERTASYFGISYGTYLGAVYATLFPERADRVLIDSSLGAGGWDRAGSRLFARGFQDRFPDFANHVARHHPDFGLGRTPEQVTRKYYELTQRLDAVSTEAGAYFRQVTFAGLYYDRGLSRLAETWREVNNGNLRPAARSGANPVDNYLSSQLHVICNDSRWPTSVRTYVKEHARDRVRYRMFGAAAANIGPCAFWPDPVEPQVRIGDRGPSTVLIVQNRRDPVTPLAAAEHMRAALGQRARMIVIDQGGHLAYPFKDNRCANDRATEFLVSGKRIERDLACAAEAG